MSFDKEYISEFKLGVVTDTWDLDGEVIETKKVKKLNTVDVSEKLSKLIGKYRQTPPMYSAIKYNGKPLYYYARRSQKVNVKPRLVIINDIELLSLKENICTVRINCSSGTYIRSIAHEVGEMFGCGAAVKKLVRTKIGNYDVKDSIKLEDFISNKVNVSTGVLKRKSYFISLEEVLNDKLNIYIRDRYKIIVKNGQSIIGLMIDEDRTKSDKILTGGELVKVRDTDCKLLAIHEILSKVDLSRNSDKYIKLTKSIVIC